MMRSWLEDFPADLPTHHALAETYITLSRYLEAKAQYERILAITPDSPRALNKLACGRTGLGETAAARKKGPVLAPAPAPEVEERQREIGRRRRPEAQVSDGQSLQGSRSPLANPAREGPPPSCRRVCFRRIRD